MAAERSAETQRGGAADTWRRAVAWRETAETWRETADTQRETTETWRNAETWRETADTQKLPKLGGMLRLGKNMLIHGEELDPVFSSFITRT